MIGAPVDGGATSLVYILGGEYPVGAVAAVWGGGGWRKVWAICGRAASAWSSWAMDRARCGSSAGMAEIRHCAGVDRGALEGSRWKGRRNVGQMLALRAVVVSLSGLAGGAVALGGAAIQLLTRGASMPTGTPPMPPFGRREFPSSLAQAIFLILVGDFRRASPLITMTELLHRPSGRGPSGRRAIGSGSGMMISSGATSAVRGSLLAGVRRRFDQPSAGVGHVN